MFPVKPGGHMQVNVAFPSIQVAPFIQGFEAHSLISILQSLPTKHKIYIIQLIYILNKNRKLLFFFIVVNFKKKQNKTKCNDI